MKKGKIGTQTSEGEASEQRLASPERKCIMDILFFIIISL